ASQVEPLTEEVQGGPKTQELPSEFVSSTHLCTEVNINPDLLKEQQIRIQNVLKQRQAAFGLDGRLGNYEAEVEIKLRPGSQPISLPPYNASPANRKIIDEQMDFWISLEVIEESQSPWGSPALISYRNSK
ncbi:hypothetical protein M422DRAFT_130501, partial [Sphaerobolus stellatus SS14]